MANYLFCFVISSGGGINERNLQRILEQTGCREFHSSASTTVQSDMKFRNTSINMGAALSPPEFVNKITSTDRVRELIDISKKQIN